MEAPCFREIAIWTGVLFDKIKEKLSWMHGLSTFLQYNEAKPLNDSGNHEYFEQQGQLGGLGHPNYHTASSVTGFKQSRLGLLP